MYKVIIADDEKYVRQNILGSIDWSELGLEVAATVSNGQEALSKIEQYQPSIVITDIKMPLVDGIQLIKLAKAKYPNMFFVILSGYDDFVYTKEAIKLGVHNYIKKPVEEAELRETLLLILQQIQQQESLGSEKSVYINNNENAAYMVRNNLMNQLVHKNILAPELQTLLTRNQFVLYVLRYKTNDRVHVSEPLVLELLKKKIAEAFTLGNDLRSASTSMTMPTSSKQFILFEDTHYSNTLSIIVNDDTLDSATLDKLAASVESGIDSIHLRGAASPVFHDIWEIKKHYQSVIHLLKSTVLLGEPMLLKQDMLHQPDKAFLEFIYSSLDRIGKSIEDRSFSQVNATLENILNDKNCSRFSIDLLESVVIHLGNMLKKLAALYNLSINRSSVEQIFDRDFMLRFENLAELSNYFEQIINEVFATFHCLEGTSIIEKILLYITTHYNAELSLSTIAKEFFINPSYLSTAFKHKTGTNFSTYVEELRIKQAIYLLNHTDLEIGAIANEVGYLDQNYFSKIFKKRTGESPSHYGKHNTSVQ